ncbi:hypothetical protein GGF31_008703 [Allomyces arbusculus]|nr:hypothetical protein GGF31_008703 [Allomyces arbusculus]
MDPAPPNTDARPASTPVPPLAQRRSAKAFASAPPVIATDLPYRAGRQVDPPLPTPPMSSSTSPRSSPTGTPGSSPPASRPSSPQWAGFSASATAVPRSPPRSPRLPPGAAMRPRSAYFTSSSSSSSSAPSSPTVSRATTPPGSRPPSPPLSPPRAPRRASSSASTAAADPDQVIDAILRATSYYAALGVPRTATTAEIRRAYLDKSRYCHPDKHADRPRATEAFQKLISAYSTLKQTSTRAAYDIAGDRAAAAAAAAAGGTGTATGGDASLDQVLVQLWFEFLDGHFDNLLLLADMVARAPYPAPVATAAAAFPPFSRDRVEALLVQVRDVLLTTQHCLDAARPALDEAVQMHANLAALSYLDVLGRSRQSLRLLRTLLTVPITVHTAAGGAVLPLWAVAILQALVAAVDRVEAGAAAAGNVIPASKAAAVNAVRSVFLNTAGRAGWWWWGGHDRGKGDANVALVAAAAEEVVDGDGPSSPTIGSPTFAPAPAAALEMLPQLLTAASAPSSLDPTPPHFDRRLSCPRSEPGTPPPTLPATPARNGPLTLDALPLEILGHVMEHLTAGQRGRVRGVCRRFDDAVTHGGIAVWRRTELVFRDDWKYAVPRAVNVVRKHAADIRLLTLTMVRDDVVEAIVPLVAPFVASLRLHGWRTLSDHAFHPVHDWAEKSLFLNPNPTSAIEPYFPRLRSFELVDAQGWYSAIGSRTVASVTSASPRLERLVVWCNSLIDPYATRAAARACPNMHTLALSSFQLHHDADLAVLVHAWPKLKYLQLSHAARLSDAAWVAAAHHGPLGPPRELEVIAVHGMPAPSEADEGVEEGTAHLGATKVGLRAMAAVCPKLTTVKVFDCPGVAALGALDPFGFESVASTPAIQYEPCFHVNIAFGYTRSRTTSSTVAAAMSPYTMQSGGVVTSAEQGALTVATDVANLAAAAGMLSSSTASLSPTTLVIPV